MNRYHLGKTFYRAYAGNECVGCGKSVDMGGRFNFHHVKENKSFNPASRFDRGDVATTLKEVDKCILVCNPCHRAIHDAAWRAGKWHPERVGK
jgi:hypothetical protein